MIDHLEWLAAAVGVAVVEVVWVWQCDGWCHIGTHCVVKEDRSVRLGFQTLGPKPYNNS